MSRWVMSRPPPSSASIGFACAAAGAALFSLKGVVIKLAYEAGLSVHDVLTLRMAFALPFYLVIGVAVFHRAGRRPPWTVWLIACGLGVISYYMSSYLDFLGLQYITAQLERLILYVYPTIVALLAWLFLKQPLTMRHAAALGLAYAGLAILFGSEMHASGPQAGLGAALVAAAAILYAVYVVSSRPVIDRMGSALFTSVAMSAASLLFLAQGAISRIGGPASAPPTMEGLMLTAGLAVFCTVIPSFLISEAISRIGPGPTSAVGGVGPIVAAWAAVVVLNEPFGFAHIAAMVLTMTGVWLLASAGAPKRARPEP